MRVRELGHVALYAKNVQRMTEFYQEIFDLTVSAQDKTGSITFLGVDPHKNHHDLAFVSNRGAAHICYYVDSLSEFREFYSGLKSRNIPILNCQMVMLGLRMDFHDPEGNVAEVVWRHGKWGLFPFFRKVDLDTMTDEDIIKIVDEMPLDERDSDSRQDSRAQDLLQMIFGRHLSHCVYVAAKLGVADFLKNGPCGIQELARQTSTDENNLYRLLRTLAGLGIFKEVKNGGFELTAMGELLRSDIPGSLRYAAMNWGSNHQLLAWGELLHSVQTGEAAFPNAHGVAVFDYYQNHRDEFEVFSKTMTGMSDMVNEPICNSYNFSGIQKLIDVGGGYGSLIKLILQKKPHIQGTVFDLPEVVENAQPIDRCEFQAGNFFESIPSGHDAYLFKYILHDWNDEQVIRILQNCRQSIPEHGKVLIIEHLIPEKNQPSMAHIIDMEMMVMTGGKERTKSEYRSLLETAGFELSRLITTPSPMFILEGIPKI